MANTVILGAQWGDEGKGKIIDVLSAEADIVVRYQGGSNAGHTVKIGDNMYVLHLIPSGILHKDKICIIGNGVVVDPISLLSEMSDLETKGISTAGRLFLSDRAHLVMPYHKAIDATREAKSKSSDKIGTTKRGIGPSYGDKAYRIGLRAGDMLEPSFPAMLASRIDYANSVLASLGSRPENKDIIVAAYTQAAAKLAPFVADTVGMINKAASENKKILFEGAQGTMLDIDFGSYPYVTSSNATSGGACTGTGISPHRIERVIGVVKAYTTRVGEGPFPTELFDDVGRHLGTEGKEFGATTGRPRRCGWFDAVVARYSAMINGVDFWAITKLDVLDGLKTIKICVAYDCNGKRYDTVPASIQTLQQCKPVYEEMPGWESPTTEARKLEDLPPKAVAYVNRLCDLTGVKLGMLSVGPKRDSTMRMGV